MVSNECRKAAAGERAQRLRVDTQLVRKVLRLVVAVGHTYCAVGQGVQYIFISDLLRALVREDHADLLAAALVENGGNLCVPPNNVVALIDVEEARLLLVLAKARPLFGRSQNERNKETAEKLS